MSVHSQEWAALQAALGGQYTLDRELGGGGMSRVFVARDVALGRDVVVKLLAPELAEGLSAERFAREIRLAAALQEPHIVPVLSAGMLAGALPYYTMPFVRGASLRQRVAEGPVPLPEAVGILRDVARALAYAHSQHVVHRDIKPENVLLSSGTAVVTDFGIARALSAARTRGDAGDDDPARAAHTSGLTQVGTSLGTPAYMAPEQAAGDSAVDCRADLYAWGVVAYELLAGAHPFADRLSARALMAAHLSEVPPPLTLRAPVVPPALATLVMRCLAKEPHDRPASASEILHALDAGSLSAEHERAMPAADAPPRVHSRRRRALAAAGVALVVLVGGLAVLRAARARTAGHGVTAAPTPSMGFASVAVLPLVNVGGDTAQEYFSDGLTDELTSALGGVPGLRVASRTSAYALKGKGLGVQAIAESLHVGAVLEGTVRRAGDHLKIGAQLTSAGDGLTLWSQSYERGATDLFAVQDEIARAITDALQRRLGPGQLGTVAPVRQYDLQAYDLFLQAEFFYRKHTEASLRRSIPLYEAAVARDSTLASRAWFGVAAAWAWLADDWDEPRLAWPRSKAAALRALAADSTFQPARSALGVVLTFYDHDFTGAEQLIREAIARDSTSGHYDLADVLSVTGRVDEAVASMRRAQRMDPLDPQTTTRLGDLLAFAGRDEDARAQYRAALELDRDYPNALLGLATVLIGQGSAAEALRVLARMEEPTTRGQVETARAYATLGRRGEAEVMVRDLQAQSRRRYVHADGIASIYLALGDHDAAFRWLDRAATERAAGTLFLRVRPMWAPLRGDPRFEALVRRVGLP